MSFQQGVGSDEGKGTAWLFKKNSFRQQNFLQLTNHFFNDYEMELFSSDIFLTETDSRVEEEEEEEECSQKSEDRLRGRFRGGIILSFNW